MGLLLSPVSFAKLITEPCEIFALTNPLEKAVKLKLSDCSAKIWVDRMGFHAEIKLSAQATPKDAGWVISLPDGERQPEANEEFTASVLVKATQANTPIEISAVNPSGDLVVSKFELRLQNWDASVATAQAYPMRPAVLEVGVGAASVYLTDSRLPTVFANTTSVSTLAPDIYTAFSFPVGKPGWNLNSNLRYTSQPLSSAVPLKSSFFAANFDVSYTFLRLGWYHEIMLSSENSIGFAYLTGPKVGFDFNAYSWGNSKIGCSLAWAAILTKENAFRPFINRSYQLGVFFETGDPEGLRPKITVYTTDSRIAQITATVQDRIIALNLGLALNLFEK